MKKDKFPIFLVIIFIIFFVSKINSFFNNGSSTISNDNKVFRIISSPSTEKMDDKIIKFGKKRKINIEIEHYGDLEIVDILNSNSQMYDAVWISNSIWLYMLDNSYLVTDSKSIVIDPVVMGIQKSKAEKLNFTNGVIYNKDILNAVRNNDLKYIMASVTKTNTGATSYLSFLNSLAGSPEVLTESMLDSNTLKTDLKDLFKGVERVSGDESYLRQMYQNGNYDAIIDYESSLIEINKELIKNKKEPLYLIYPVDGVAINDMPFAYINNDALDTKTKKQFEIIQNYLRSDEMLKVMEEYGYRSWYGGVNEKADKSVFNPDWGIDTTKYLKDMKYPSKKVITKALNLYVNTLRKPTHAVFCLDVSGSMYGSGLSELKEAMDYILDYEKSSKDYIQFSDEDKITIITFDSAVKKIYDTKLGSEAYDVMNYINELEAYGGTNIYDPTIEALKILKKDDSNEYNKTVILMTDGLPNAGSFNSLRRYYNSNNEKTPIYSITFGNSSEYDLNELASLSNGKVFDGKNGLVKAFKEVRSYS